MSSAVGKYPTIAAQSGISGNGLYVCVTRGFHYYVKPGTHWQQSRLLPKPATNRQQAEFDSLSRSTLSPTRSTLLSVCTGLKATRSTLSTSTFNKVDRVEFNFVASVYRALEFSNSAQHTAPQFRRHAAGTCGLANLGECGKIHAVSYCFTDFSRLCCRTGALGAARIALLYVMMEIGNQALKLNEALAYAVFM